MKYPFIHNYMEALMDCDSSLRHTRGCKVCFDQSGGPEFRARSGRVGFKVEYDGQLYALICKTRDDNYTTEATFDDEIYVFNDYDQGDYYKVYFCKLNPTGNSPCCKFEWSAEDNEGLTAVEDAAGMFGYIDGEGRVVIACEYDWVDDFCEGLAVVCKNGYYGCINRHGEVVIPLVYDEASWDGQIGLFGVEKEGLNGFLNREGRVVVPLKYEWRGEFSDGLAMMKRDGYYCYVDRNGDEVIPPLYEDAGTFRNGFAEVVRNGEVYSINTKGEKIIER